MAERCLILPRFHLPALPCCHVNLSICLLKNSVRGMSSLAACLVLSSIDRLELPVCLLGSQLSCTCAYELGRACLLVPCWARFCCRPSPCRIRAAPPRRVSMPLVGLRAPPHSGDLPSAGLSATGRTSCRSWVPSSSLRLRRQRRVFSFPAKSARRVLQHPLLSHVFSVEATERHDNNTGV